MPSDFPGLFNAFALLALPVAQSYADFLEAQAAELEIPLKAEAEKWASPYAAPSHIWLMRKSAELYRSGNALVSGQPRSILDRLSIQS